MRFRVALAMQRTAHHLRARSRLLALPVILVYRTYALFILGVDIPVTTRIGRRVQIFHGFGLVIHPNAVIGDRVVLRQNTTIGALGYEATAPAPRIGAGVDVGSNAVLLGDIVIGDNARIGAGAVVLQSVPEAGVAVGNPARILGARACTPS